MARQLWAALLFFAGQGALHAEPTRDPVEALEEALQRAIDRAEPSIACVLVSRSDSYRRFEGPPSTEIPGRLGTFKPGRGPLDDPLQKQLRALDLSNPDNAPESYGSGVVLDADPGLVLTCAHVVQGATKVYVRLPGGKGSYADIHALDPRSDLAVLRLIDKVPDLRPLKLGAGEKMRKGQFVLTLANPYAAGFRDGSPTASWGIVGNVRRRLPGATSESDRSLLTLSQFATLVQLDTRLNAGCSGGAVLNREGELIGLTTAQASLTGLDTPGGFAIPFDAALRRLIDTLRRGEEIEYGFLGVQFDPNSRDGARVRHAIGNSPGKRAGIQDHDYILSVNGKPIRSTDDVFLAIGVQMCGSTVEVERSRSPRGPGSTVSVKLAKFYVPRDVIASKRPPARGGLRVDHASIYYQRSRGDRIGVHDGIPDGVVIREVVPGSSADKARLQPDKVITHVNGRRVLSPAEFNAALAEARDSVELTLLGEGGKDRVTLDLKGQP